MNLIGRVSDEEVLAAIRYLDPELLDGRKREENEGIETRSRRQAEIACVVSSIGVILWITALRYLPTIWQFLSQRLGPELFR